MVKLYLGMKQEVHQTYTEQIREFRYYFKNFWPPYDVLVKQMKMEINWL